jgi:beta-lactamase class A
VVNPRTGAVVARIRGAFHTVGVRGWLHVQDMGDPTREVDVDAGHRVPLASVFKLLVAVAVAREIDAGRLQATSRVRVGARRTAGPTGLAAMRDPVAMSVRDLVLLMLTVSDNAACDVLYDLVGSDAVAAVPSALGLRATTVRGAARDFLGSIPTDLGVEPREVASALTSPGALERLSVLDPARTTSGTPRDLTRLLRLVWRDEAASAAGCQELRRALALQVWPHRLAAGFPEDDVVVSGKTGTVPALRAEAGVVERPAGRSFAITVVTRSETAALNLPRVDAAIGACARMAVDALDP